ncbi:hypothetical protein I316_04439 [Kwoniella heveanensis BCC8398]|uniref:Short-chain dehydrogenase n=1 Tax=Kwoniella heveanensis BCC8398 TaxID=1296120 RepID=A0A1B9GRV8_9TREE|nr:hypothetical protein I316_04439 [Kwoniella heveanensis BCC8398]
MSTTFDQKCTGIEVAEAFSKEIRGKTILVTGGTLGGLGAEFVKTIVKHSPKLVILTARTKANRAQTRGYRSMVTFFTYWIDETFDAIRQDTPEAPVRSLILDLSSLKDVRRAADEVNAYGVTIDILVHNAGVAGCPLDRTEDGFPLVLATNHIGPFLLTKLLLPKMRAEGRIPRIVFVASSAHKFVDTFRWDDPLYLKEDEYGPASYPDSKIPSYLFAPALVRRSGGGVHAYTVCPGIVYTQLQRYLAPEQKQKMGYPSVVRLHERGWESQDGNIPHRPRGYHIVCIEDLDNTGCGFPAESDYLFNALIAAFDLQLFDAPGAHISSACKIAPEDVAEHAKGLDLEERMWALSEGWIGGKFEL